MSGSKVTWAKYFMRSIITLLRDNICPGQKLLGLNVLFAKCFISIITLLRDNICPGQTLFWLNIYAINNYITS